MGGRESAEDLSDGIKERNIVGVDICGKILETRRVESSIENSVEEKKMERNI